MHLIIPEWWLIVITVYLAISAIMSLRRTSLSKRALQLEKERFAYEKNIKQYAKAIADAERIANTPKHSRR